MTQSVTLQEAQEHLEELVRKLGQGDEVIITENAVPIAKIVANIREIKEPRIPGLGKGFITIVDEDNDHLQDFSDYMR